MCADEVPQDQCSTYAGHKKLLYAQDATGEYTGVQSSGWEAEAAATLDAVAQFEAERSKWPESTQLMNVMIEAAPRYASNQAKAGD